MTDFRYHRTLCEAYSGWRQVYSKFIDLESMASGNTKSGIRKVAQQAGVSTATVSRVLNDSESVSSETRDRVVQALQKSGYRLNAAAKALATNRTHTIAAIVPTLRHSIFAIFLDAFEDELASAGYSLVIATHGFSKDTEFKRCNEVLQLGAEAIVVSGAEHDPKFVETFKSANIPCMLTSIHKSKLPFPAFGYNNELLARTAIDYLASLGHQNIHVIHGPTTDNDRMVARVKGVLAAGKNNAMISLTLHETELGVTGGAEVARKWFCTKNALPHACLCLADVLALGVVFEATRQEIQIPSQMSLMGFENLDWTEGCSPPLTTISLPAEEMGRAAATALVNHLDHGSPMADREFQAVIVERDSTCTRK